MKVKGPVTDLNPKQPAVEHDAVTFIKTDLSREMIKGDVGVVVSVHHDNLGYYSVEVNNNTVETLHRSEFRLATPEDLARMRKASQKMEDRAKRNGTARVYKFRIPQFPGDPKI